MLGKGLSLVLMILLIFSIKGIPLAADVFNCTNKIRLIFEIILYVIITICVILGPIFSFSVNIARETNKEDDEQSTGRYVGEFFTDLAFFILSWVWFTIRFFRVGERLKDCSNDILYT